MASPSPTSSPPALTPSATLFTSDYLRLLAVQMAFGISYSSFLLLPKYFRQELHASAAEIGQAASVALVAAALLAPLIGLSGRLIPRRTLLVVALSLEAAVGFAFLSVERIGPFVFALRAAQGLAWAIVFNVTATLAAELVPREKMAQAIGYLGLSMLMTNAMAPLFAEPIAARFGWGAVFAFAGTSSALVLFLVRRLPGGVLLRASEESRGSVFLELLPVHFASFLMGAGIGVMFTFTQPFALAQGASRVGDFFLGYVAAAAFVRTVLARVSDRVGPAKVAAASLGLYALVVALAARLTPSLLIPLGLGIGASHGLMYPALTATGLRALPTASRTVFMGYFSAAFNTGCALATLTLGFVADRHGFPTVFLIGGVALATGVLPLARFAFRPRER